MANPWMAHVKATMKANPKLKFKDVLVKAGKTYKKKPGVKSAKKTKGKKSKKQNRKTRRKGSKKQKGGKGHSQDLTHSEVPV